MKNFQKIKLTSPIALKWSISEERLKGTHDKYFKSDTFTASTIPDVEYYIAICQKDDEKETDVYLNLIFDDMVIEADWDIRIESANYSLNMLHVFDDANKWNGYYCTIKELFDPENRYILDGNLTIKMDGILMVNKEVPKKTETFGNFDDAICLGLWNQDENKDFSIVLAEGKEILVHKCVLAARSSVFAAMFDAGKKEAKENKVKIKEFSLDIVEKAIKLCYHQSLVTDTTMEDKYKLLQFFDKYDIKPLKDDLESFMVTVIDETTVCRLTNASLLSNSSKLEKKCAEFLQTCFEMKKPVSDFDMLDKDFALNLFKNAFYPVSK